MFVRLKESTDLFNSTVGIVCQKLSPFIKIIIKLEFHFFQIFFLRVIKIEKILNL